MCGLAGSLFDGNLTDDSVEGTVGIRMTETLWKERFELAGERIGEIQLEETAKPPYCAYFQKMAAWICEMTNLWREVGNGEWKRLPLTVLREKNRSLYEDILPEHYGTSYGNPTYACKVLGSEFGPLLSFLYTELRGMIVYAFENRKEDLLISMELFLQVYGEFENGEIPSGESIRQILYWYVNDYCQDMVTYRVREAVDPSLSFAVDLIMEADLADLRYLYQFGEYVTGQDEQTASFLNSLPEEEIQAMASTYTEGYRIGFLTTGKDIHKKKTVNIRYCLGFERMIRAAIVQFRAMGLEPVIYRAATHSVNRRQHFRVGYYGTIPNEQYDYDHRNDSGLYLDDDFVGRKLRCMQNAYESYSRLAAEHGGPAVVEVFGNLPFEPVNCSKAITLTKKQQRLEVHMNNEAGRITNRYIKGEERSFTIIAYPVPEIGEQFEDIFRETVKINTLDYQLYRKMQQCIIAALDLGERVHVLGRDGNETDLYIHLHTLQNPAKETNFENCVADVNIPVGEVFTSPVLEGTGGTLHVKKVYLEGLQYRDLKLSFADGKISGYSCGNFEEEESNLAYIRENILHHHETLPMGEFAIGTNTTAYRMARTYHIEDKLPILIAEKTGPHFAVGDTCYSWAEDTAVYNPDGKEIIARDNEISILRKEDPAKAYFGCHTDITIPYEELGAIIVETSDGRTIDIIRNGRFVLPGTEKLNEPLD